MNRVYLLHPYYTFITFVKNAPAIGEGSVLYAKCSESKSESKIEGR